MQRIMICLFVCLTLIACMVGRGGQVPILPTPTLSPSTDTASPESIPSPTLLPTVTPIPRTGTPMPGTAQPQSATNLTDEEIVQKYFRNAKCVIQDNRVVELRLTNNQLSSLPSEIGQLTNLKGLYLSGNQLSSLPPEIGLLTNLQELSLEKNQLSSLPSEIGQLTNLQRLYLNGNPLSSLPSEISQLTNLSDLFLDSNQLSSLPLEIEQLPGLTIIRLSTPMPPISTPIPKLSTNKIVFAVSEGGIYLVDVNNNDVTMLLDSGRCCPSWSPDRQKIAFSNGWAGNYAVISVMNADGSNVRDLMEYRRPHGDMLPVRPVWSSDSQQITWPWASRDNFINFVAVDVNTGIEVYTHDAFTYDDFYTNYSIDFAGVTEVFSPDGQYIASVSYDKKKILIKNTNDDRLVKELIIEQGRIYGIDW